MSRHKPNSTHSHKARSIKGKSAKLKEPMRLLFLSFQSGRQIITLPEIHKVMAKIKKIHLKVERRWPTENYTIGRFYVSGEFWCNTLEDKVRDLDKEGKIPGKTAIPAGRYDVSLTYSPRFKKQLPILWAVPHFSGIRIHAGNTPDDTEGCILLGENKEKGKVLNSRFWVDKLIDILKENGGEATIEIV